MAAPGAGAAGFVEFQEGVRTLAETHGSPNGARTLPRSPWPALIAAWLIPGGGHLMLGRRPLAAAFFALVLLCFLIGLGLHGELWSLGSPEPLTKAAALAQLGTGLPYVVAQFLAHYQGQVTAAGYEYGNVFLLTAGLMNLLLLLEVYDLATGRKE